ncbi:MAG: hypothetical protein ACI9CZ_000531 [Flavobacterium sp.]
MVTHRCVFFGSKIKRNKDIELFRIILQELIESVNSFINFS